MKFKCNFGANIFARLFELVIEKDIMKLDGGKYYNAHYACCTFNTLRQNSRKGLNWIQLAPCSKNNLSKDWSSYWFYVKVDMSTVPGYTGPAYPFYSPMALVTVVCTASYNKRVVTTHQDNTVLSPKSDPLWSLSNSKVSSSR
jgi:hypothetical protein